LFTCHLILDAEGIQPERPIVWLTQSPVLARQESQKITFSAKWPPQIRTKGE
jgi:hypothetical protein